MTLLKPSCQYCGTTFAVKTVYRADRYALKTYNLCPSHWVECVDSPYTKWFCSKDEATTYQVTLTLTKGNIP